MAEKAKTKKKKLGKYTVIRQIGQGSAANIYLARQEGLDRPLVIKELLPQYGSNEKIINRFKREARIISQLSHDTIVHIYDTWVRTRSYYIAMEYIQGYTLKAILEKAVILPPRIAGIIVYQICRGLAHAHASGVVHRDLKPANIMISETGHVKILDFGIAHFQFDENLTSHGALLGTYNYMSPEQSLGKQIGPSSDIFSLGILFYELLTGLKPFVKDDKADVLEKIIHKGYPPVRRINPAVPTVYSRIIRKALRKRPSRRFHNTGRIMHRLEKRLKKYSLDHQDILKSYLENIRPRNDPHYPPRFWRRVWYRLTHQSVRTYLAVILLALSFIIMEYRLITSGWPVRRQWNLVRKQAASLYSALRSGVRFAPGSGPEHPDQ